MRENPQAFQRPIRTGLWPGTDTPGLFSVVQYYALLKVFSNSHFTPNYVVGVSFIEECIGAMQP
jgi:hypothetical protein